MPFAKRFEADDDNPYIGYSPQQVPKDGCHHGESPCVIMEVA